MRDAWSAAGGFGFPRDAHTAALLTDDSVRLVGGRDGAGDEASAVRP